MKFAFLVQTTVHVRTFLPVAEVLRDVGEPLWISLHALNRWGADRALRQEGIASVDIPGPKDGSRFAHLPLHKMYRELFCSIRPALAAILEKFRPRVLLLAHDRGLAEKEAIYRARATGAKSLLVNESAIWRSEIRRQGFHWRRPTSVKVLFTDVAKELLSTGLRTVGQERIAPTYIGEGGCDRIAVCGEATRRVLVDRGVDIRKIEVTGQPRFDGMSGITSRRTEIRKQLGFDDNRVALAIFTSGFGTQNLHAEQRRQETFVQEAVRYIAARHRERFVVVIRPHPREAAAPYQKAVADCPGARVVTEGLTEELLAAADHALTVPSTVLVECAFVQTPASVFRVIGGPRCDINLGLPAGVIPEIAGIGELHRHIDKLAVTNSQMMPGPYMDDLVSRPAAGAASRVADLVRELAS